MCFAVFFPGKSAAARAQGGKSGAAADSAGNVSENVTLLDVVKVEPGAGAGDSSAMDVDE